MTAIVIALTICLSLSTTVGNLRDENLVLENKVADMTHILEQKELELEHRELEIVELNDRVGELVAGFENYEVYQIEATGYAPYDNKSGICSNGDPDNTATMTKPRPGVVAVNPKIIPYGTKMYIQGYGWGVAEDTGGAMRARTDLIDLYFDTHKEAMRWGRQKVYILVEKGETKLEPSKSEDVQWLRHFLSGAAGE